MADNSNIQAYPYMFDPSQFANPYSQYNKKPMPWPSQYSGVPTDALGQPIQSYLDAQKAVAAPPAMPPSTTLNSTGALYQAGQPGHPGYQTSNTWSPGQFAAGAPGVSNAQSLANRQTLTNQMQGIGPVMGGGGAGGGGAAAPAPAVPASAAPDMNAAYLAALSNPGKVTTPGATVPQAASPTGQSSVLQQFLANWQNKGQPTQGAGNYNNAGFFNALQGGM